MVDGPLQETLQKKNLTVGLGCMNDLKTIYALKIRANTKIDSGKAFLHPTSRQFPYAYTAEGISQLGHLLLPLPIFTFMAPLTTKSLRAP